MRPHRATATTIEYIYDPDATPGASWSLFSDNVTLGSVDADVEELNDGSE